MQRVEDDDLKAKGKALCGRCGGTGMFVTGTVNGKPTGPGGICFRCNGKGFHTEEDRRRNWGYEMFGRRITL